MTRTTCDECAVPGQHLPAKVRCFCLSLRSFNLSLRMTQVSFECERLAAGARFSHLHVHVPLECAMERVRHRHASGGRFIPLESVRHVHECLELPEQAGWERDVLHELDGRCSTCVYASGGRVSYASRRVLFHSMGLIVVSCSGRKVLVNFLPAPTAEDSQESFQGWHHHYHIPGSHQGRRNRWSGVFGQRWE